MNGRENRSITMDAIDGFVAGARPNETYMNADFIDYEEDYFLRNLQNGEESRARWNIKLLFCIGYGALFLLGTMGNGYVISMIGDVMLTMSKQRLSGRRINVSSTMHVFIYVLGLSIVDFFVVLHLPFLIVEMLKGEWIFGQVMCKLYWYGESVNKLLSSFLMTVLSWDRYLAVCSPLSSFRMRTNSVALSVVITFYFLATLLLYPVLRESNVFQVNKLNGIRLLDDSEELAESSSARKHMGLIQFVDRLGLTISKCIFDYGSDTSLFMVYTFVVGYLLPALLIIYFYLKVILRLRRNTLTVRKYSDQQSIQISNNMFRKVMQRIITVVLFYFFCWTPYWALNIMAQFGVIVVSWSTLTLSSVFFSAHLLVCFNSAANPVLYALINRELRQQHVEAIQRRRQSLHKVTACAVELMERRTQRFSSASSCISQPKAAPFTAVDNAAESARASDWSVDSKQLNYLYEMPTSSPPSACCPLLFNKRPRGTPKSSHATIVSAQTLQSHPLKSLNSDQRRNHSTPLLLTSPLRRSVSSNDLLLSSHAHQQSTPGNVLASTRRAHFRTDVGDERKPLKLNRNRFISLLVNGKTMGQR